MRAPIPASFSDATCPMPEVAPVITTTFPCIFTLTFSCLQIQFNKAKSQHGAGSHPCQLDYNS